MPDEYGRFRPDRNRRERERLRHKRADIRYLNRERGRNRERMRAVRKLHRKQGLCHDCSRPTQGRRRCAHCLERERKRDQGRRPRL